MPGFIVPPLESIAGFANVAHRSIYDSNSQSILWQMRNLDVAGSEWETVAILYSQYEGGAGVLVRKPGISEYLGLQRETNNTVKEEEYE